MYVINSALQDAAYAAPVIEERPGYRKHEQLQVEIIGYGIAIVQAGQMGCQDCGLPINPQYIATEKTWAAAGYLPDPKGGFACICCLSKRLKRKLTREDFTDFPVNYWLEAIAIQVK